MSSRAALVLFRLCAAFLLTMISLQATEPVRAPLQRVTGSAFSAATSDMALVSTRRSTVAATPALPTPPLPDPVAEVAVPVRLALAPVADHVFPPARAPPRARPDRVPDLRGPPLT